MSWIACMAHIKHTEREYLKKYIDNRFTDYIIAYEKSQKVGEHVHFILWAEDPQDYHKFAQNVFKQKYRLRGRAEKGKCRQYGKIKKIEDIEKMMQYTVKDGNCDYKIGAHLSKDDIKQAFDKSYKKSDNYDKLEKIMLKYIDENKTKKYPTTMHDFQSTATVAYTIDREQFITKYTTVYFELFGRVPTRNMIINAVVKYDTEGGIKWYIASIRVLNEFNMYEMEFIN